jgi:ketosteroid isomerase-like protein
LKPNVRICRWSVVPPMMLNRSPRRFLEVDMSAQFDEFMRQREAASTAYIRGDTAALEAMLTHQDPATFMPPSGDVVEGADAVKRAQVTGAAAFGPGSSGHFEVLNSGSSGDLAFWTGRQIATMDVKGQDDVVSMVLRTTEIFRREDDHWKLVHRHADLSKPSTD